MARQGKTFEFAHGDVVLHPLDLDQLQDLEEDIKKLGDPGPRKETNARLAKIICAGAFRTSPDLTPTTLLKMVDMKDLNDGKLNEAVVWLMGRSGLRVTEDAGDPKAPATPLPGTSGTPA